MSKTKKKQHSGIAKKIIVTLLCLVVLAVLGLSIASNVQLYNKVTDLTAALDDASKTDVDPPIVDDGDQPNEDPTQFKPIDSSIPVTLRADGDGQHLYLNTNKEDLNAFKSYADESGACFFIFASHEPYSGDPDELYNFFGGDGIAFMLIFEDDEINIMFINEDRSTLYDFTTEEFGDDNAQITGNGEITISDDVLDYFGLDTVYIYPAISIIPDDFEGDLDDGSLIALDEVNKLFAFSPFGNQ